MSIELRSQTMAGDNRDSFLKVGVTEDEVQGGPEEIQVCDPNGIPHLRRRLNPDLIEDGWRKILTLHDIVCTLRNRKVRLKGKLVKEPLFQTAGETMNQGKVNVSNRKDSYPYRIIAVGRHGTLFALEERTPSVRVNERTHLRASAGQREGR